MGDLNPVQSPRCGTVLAAIDAKNILCRSSLQPFFSPTLLPPMSDQPVLDPQAIENLRALNPGDNDEFLREITAIFLEDTPQRVAELDQSLVSGDTSKFTRAAHSIKGSSANIGATGLRAVAEKLEHQSRLQGLTEVPQLIEQLKQEYGRTEVALRALVGR
jgi:HPt (histidine-containing phosphotransfer) domain-containing protein